MSEQRKPDLDEDAPFPGLSALRDVTPPPSLVPSVMRRIAEPAPVSFWGWLRRPRRVQLRVSPLGAVGFALTATLAVLAVRVQLGGDRPRPPGNEGLVVRVPEATTPAATVVVRFTLLAHGAKKVAVAGDFNGWDPERTPLADQDGGGAFAGVVSLPPGAHEYMFVVDGEWVTDPAAPERRPDGFGRDNAVLRL
jgi:hypothetical protein